MAAGNQQRDKRILRRIIFQHRRQQVPFHMVYRDRRHVPGEGQRAAYRRADQQRANQAGARRIRNGIDILCRQPGFLERRLNQGDGFTYVVARGQLGHHAAVVSVQFHLTIQLVG